METIRGVARFLDNSRISFILASTALQNRQKRKVPE